MMENMKKQRSQLMLLALMLTTGLMGCSMMHPRLSDQAPNEYESGDSGLYEVVSGKDILDTLNESPASYHLLYFDLRNNKSETKRRLIKRFGESLGQDAIIVDFNEETLTQEKLYFEQIQISTGSDFEYYQSPFLLALKKNRKDNYSVLDTIPFNGLTDECMQDQLDRIERQIHKGTIASDIISQVSKGRLLACGVSNETIPAIEHLLKLLEVIFGDSHS